MSNWLVRNLQADRPGGLLGARVQTIVVCDSQEEARQLGAKDLGVPAERLVVVNTDSLPSSFTPGIIR